MTMHDHSSTDNPVTSGRGDQGFTLVEILIAIVLVGILSAVVVVGISNLTSKGSTSACNASLDAAKAGSVVYFTSNSAYPTTFTQMTTATTGANPIPAALTLPSGVTVNTSTAATNPVAPIGMQAASSNWQLTMTAGVSGAAPTFVCTP
jgi:prepilin-type N-terminal cleavage/methylation domain-containing protein